LRVLLVTPMVPDSQGTGGGAITLAGELETMASRHSVTVAAFSWEGARDLPAIHRLEIAGIAVHIVAKSLRGPVRLAPAWLWRPVPLRAIQLFEPAMQQLLDHLFADSVFDLIQVETGLMGFYRYPSDVPMVLTEHDVEADAVLTTEADGVVGRLRHGLLHIEQRRWQQFQREVWRRFSRIQVFSTADAGRIQALEPALVDRVRINPFGIDLPDLPATDCERPYSMAFVGNFLHLPNVDGALWLVRSIMPQLRSQVPGVRLTIVGVEPPPCVRELAGENVVVTGTVPSTEPYLNEAAVVVAPLRIGGGMRVKVLQAMARGKAVVTTSLGAEGLLVVGSPPLMIADNTPRFAAAIAALLVDNDKREALGQQARAFVADHYTWAAHGKRLESIYDEILPPRHARARGRSEIRGA
jgi:polysaccharide biosynthesis protein PslH